jgi:hypothetical protein
MPRSLTIPPDLLLLLRREALSDYSVACERASIAAEQCVAVTSRPGVLVNLHTCRARVIAADQALDVVGDDVATAEEWDVSLDDPNRDLISARVSIALQRVSGDLDSSEPEILEAADTIQGLRVLLAKLASD